MRAYLEALTDLPDPRSARRAAEIGADEGQQLACCVCSRASRPRLDPFVTGAL